MPNYLVFRLFGPFAAWGDIAIGERRHVFPQPTKSAALGLVAGALGLLRTDDHQLAALHEGYGFASLVESPGVLLTDFHTAQTPPASAVRRAKGFRSRREELAIPRSQLETILSYRDYQMDALAIVCLWPLEAAPHSLDRLREALRRPIFIPYLGRRSCSPSLPFAPTIVDAASPTAALCDTRFPDDALFALIEQQPVRSFYFEGDIPDDVSVLETVRRRDVARSRVQWQFAERAEHHAVEERPDVSQQD
jgi:CRISPR system Cascade subunit CasD